ncbi:dual specificity protein phosphatase family protein [Paraglaciecola aquimarina]|uniref:Dual specificity protein phosphatase family protein n=1 Tax=Paraglaciecola algarum TaxID=3050085 RepID=A0ABS9D5Y2_9ALTE|nr:diacylglycerol kinase family protein [Paraglaciecola sp. G1-23]MCF2947835.1 dual specificity protein phosphatase family protein [Paraglaciecola sp. G1-23]
MSFYYLMGAMLTFYLGFRAENLYISLLLIWTGSSLFAVSIAYIFQAPQLFRKSSNGAIPFYIRWLFIPFLFGTQLYNSWARRADKVPPIQEIDKNLFLACRLFPSDIDELKQNNVTAVLDVTAEFDGLDWSSTEQQLNYLNLPVLDHQSPTAEQLIHAANWIQTHLDNNQGVVVHCALGRGRSVLVLTAYLLMQAKHDSIQSALSRIKDIRKTAGLNKHQLKKLNKIVQNKLKDFTPKRLALIANPVSGGGKWQESKHQIIQRLTAKYVLDIYVSTPETSASTLTEQAIKAEHNVFIACGGDGTINEVAAKIVNQRHTLGMIPLGTTNALSHVLLGTVSKVLPIEKSCEVILAEQTQTIDTAICNNELVLLMVGIGMGQKMIELADREQKNKNGQLAYLKGLWQSILDQEIQEITLTLDGTPVTARVKSINIANAAPFSTILAQGNGSPNWNDGLLDITVVPGDTDTLDTLVNMTELAFSGLVSTSGDNKLLLQQAKNIEIKGPGSIKYVIDGEEREAEKLSIKVVPHSLQILT